MGTAEMGKPSTHKKGKEDPRKEFVNDFFMQNIMSQP
jgi:hypothetical protein